MSVANLERERVACVFGLGGGELHEADERWPDEWDGPDGFVYWYEGPPDYLSADELGLDLDVGVRTAIVDCLFGQPAAPPGWEQVASFSSSGEADCWWCGEGTGHEDARDGCTLCEGDGYVYLGDGWSEIVYQRLPAVGRVPGPTE